MNKKVVLLADSARARIFEVVNRPGQAGRMEPALVELRDLVQPGRRTPVSNLLSESRPGSRQSDAFDGPGHAVDDHRGARVAEGDRRFAAEIVDALTQLCREREITELLVAAPPRFAGHLRERNIETSCGEVGVVNLDLSGMSPPEALETLTGGGHLRLG